MTYTDFLLQQYNKIANTMLKRACRYSEYHQTHSQQMTILSAIEQMDPFSVGKNAENNI